MHAPYSMSHAPPCGQYLALQPSSHCFRSSACRAHFFVTQASHISNELGLAAAQRSEMSAAVIAARVRATTTYKDKVKKDLITTKPLNK